MKKTFWYFLQLLALGLLLGAFPIGSLLDHPVAGWLVFAVVALLHISEILVTIPLAKQRNFPIGTAVLKTLLFGFTWWIPFKQGIMN
jgi:hypothetical protein